MTQDSVPGIQLHHRCTTGHHSSRTRVKLFLRAWTNFRRAAPASGQTPSVGPRLQECRLQLRLCRPRPAALRVELLANGTVGIICKAVGSKRQTEKGQQEAYTQPRHLHRAFKDLHSRGEKESPAKSLGPPTGATRLHLLNYDINIIL
ncbi:hypothetical protein NDU88_001709 [Pleurodeles waltl]|uniref:Uncharacterized protein n=1 Tax=Pleurodeles waltl TaxID=8319 RepID=A0AAV7VXJ5_PLEWA|nr:hypothetical protein NDU88_001709 [Pleurodeles waltl]